MQRVSGCVGGSVFLEGGNPFPPNMGTGMSPLLCPAWNHLEGNDREAVTVSVVKDKAVPVRV